VRLVYSPDMHLVCSWTEIDARSGHGGSGRRLNRRVLCGLPIPRQEFFDRLGEIVLQFGEDKGEPSLRIDVVQLSVSRSQQRLATANCLRRLCSSRAFVVGLCLLHFSIARDYGKSAFMRRIAFALSVTTALVVPAHSSSTKAKIDELRHSQMA
jgi:hypothetical protein